jgi:ABC-type microcin C transport system permease subunit YejB
MICLKNNNTDMKLKNSFLDESSKEYVAYTIEIKKCVGSDCAK